MGQRENSRAKTTPQATGYLVNSGTVKDEKEVSRSCIIQPRN